LRKQRLGWQDCFRLKK